jgi:hypothetical protein
LLRNILDEEVQWTGLKPKTEFLEKKRAVMEIKKILNGARKGSDDRDQESDEDDEDAPMPEVLKKTMGEEWSMSALGGLIW